MEGSGTESGVESLLCSVGNTDGGSEMHKAEKGQGMLKRVTLP